MDELTRIRNYLRIDKDMTEDDETIKALVPAAKRYISTTTGKAYKDNDAVMSLCVVLLVCHWHTDRTQVSKANVQEYRHSVTDMLKLIESSSDYEEAAT